MLHGWAKMEKQHFPEFHHALLMAGGAEMAALAGEVKQVLMAAVFAFDAGKFVMQVAPVLSTRRAVSR
jgi:hypothetical protein